MDTTLATSLNTLGITGLDQQIYLLLLEKGPLTISRLARHLNKERLTIYQAVERLQEAGLVPKGRPKYSRGVVIEPPSQVLALLEKQRTDLFYQAKQLESLLPQMSAQYAQKQRPAVFRLFEGRTQFLTVFEEALQEANGQIDYYGDTDAFVNYVGIPYEDRWVRKRVAKKIKIRMLVFRSDYVEKRYRERDKKELRQTRYITPPHRFGTSFMMYGYKTLLWNPTAERAIVLDDPALTEMYQHMFQREWLSSQAQK